MSEESKITLYLAISDEQKRSDLEMAFMTQYFDISLYALADQADYEQRLKLNPPQLIVADAQFLQGSSILKDAVTVKERAQTSYIVLGAYPGKEEFLDEMMVGKFQFFETDPGEDDWKVAIKKAFKFSFESTSASYVMKNIKMGEMLMNVGDAAEKIYILKKGKLQAYQLNDQDQKIILGEIGNHHQSIN